MPAHNFYTPKSRSQTQQDMNSSRKVHLPTSCRRESHVKTIVFERVGKLYKINGLKHMCFTIKTPPGPSRTRAAASRPSRTTAPAHNPPPLFGASHAPANKKTPLFETEKEFRTKLFQNTCVFPSKVSLAGMARRRERGDHYQTTRGRTYIVVRYTCQR